MKILVTGASGFIGRYVVREAIARGHDVLALSRSGPASGSDGVSTVWLRRDLGSIEPSELEGLEIDAVIHLAASLSGSVQERYRSTVTATHRLLDAMKQAGVSRLIGIGSIVVPDYAGLPAMAVIDENARFADDDGMEIYTKMKLEQERLFAAFAGESGHRCVVLRPGLAYDNQRLIGARAGIVKGSLSVLAVHRGEVPTVEVSGLARATLNACERDIPSGQIIHLVDDHLPGQREYIVGLRRRGVLPMRGLPVPWRILAAIVSSLRMLFRLSGGEAKLPSVFQPHGFAARFKPFRYSNEKAKRLLGWVPASSFS